MITNIFVTGDKGIGKTTLLDRVLKELEILPLGFRTIPYYIEGRRQGFYLHGFVDLNHHENDKPISVQTGPSTCIAIPEIFDILGTKILRESMVQEGKVILMDELGRLECKSFDFLAEVNKCLDDKKIVLGALKKAEASFLDGIRNRKDTIIFEITLQNRDLVFFEVIDILKNILKGESDE